VEKKGKRESRKGKGRGRGRGKVGKWESGKEGREERKMIPVFLI
jgi:hypothetical protein